MSIEKFAIWARKELISRVSQRAYQYGITDSSNVGDSNALSFEGRVFTELERKQRKELINEIQKKGYNQVMEEVAYTWFNRFIALRFMEVNNYLPSHIRVFTDINGKFKPEIIDEALNLDFTELDKQRVAKLINDSNKDELYRYLLLIQCNELNKCLPMMFERMGSFTELLLPNNILSQDGIIGRMLTEIDESEWTNQVQIIGWLYQYYNSEVKDEAYELLKKNVKVAKDRIPAVTQLFTPDWIVRYMVENSLGRKYIENSIKKSGIVDEKQRIEEENNIAQSMEWKYYLAEAEQLPEVRAILNENIPDTFKPEELKIIDPCMGSGHILVYAFEVLIKIYEKCGYDTKDAVESIIKNNLYGLEIDKRATQLAYFAIMMKAREYDRRILNRGFQPNLEHFQDLILDPQSKYLKEPYLFTVFQNADIFGSLINVDSAKVNKDSFGKESDDLENQPTDLFALHTTETLQRIQRIALMLSKKYDVVVTNPPYMGNNNMDQILSDFVKKNYPDSKSDLFACFMERCTQMLNKNGYSSLVTMQSWMFLSSFEQLRTKLINNYSITNLMHMENMVMHIAFGTAVSIIKNTHIKNYKGTYNLIKLQDLENDKPKSFPVSGNRFAQTSTDNFSKIPGSPVAYWVSKNFIEMFNSLKLEKLAYSFQGMITGDNNFYLRLWFEIDKSKLILNMSNKMASNIEKVWIPYNKGGNFRKWFGNNEYVLRWIKNGTTLTRARTENREYYFKEGITWSFLTSSNFSSRYFPNGYLWDVAGSSIFSISTLSNYKICAFMNSIVAQKIFNVINPTLNYQVENILSLPIIDNEKWNNTENLSQQNIALSKSDWDSFETSWNFEKHPLVRLKSRNLKNAFSLWMAECDDRFNQLKTNEEELNRIFIDIYGLNDELTPEVEDKDVTVRKADLQRDVKSLISYAVGCMVGRYSLDVDGLVYAGGDWDSSKYKTYIPDENNIIPICDNEYFSDDIVARFVEWVKTVYGSEDLEGNLAFIAGALGGQGASRDVIRKYFLNDFFADHCKIYQKRPIYWLFDSGKKNGFKALIYMHRYSRDLLARLRTDYVHEQQERYETKLHLIEEALSNADTKESVKLKREQTKISDQAMELHNFERKIHDLADKNIEIDLDDGVKHNYALFADVLAKLK